MTSVVHETTGSATTGSATTGSATTTELIVDFCGQETPLCPGDEWSFGRAADLIVDDNPYLHRRLGVIRNRAGTWWLHNIGSSIQLTVKDLTSRSQVTLAPGREMALSFPEAAVQFSAGRSNYELELRLLGSSVESQDHAGHETSHDQEGDCATISIADLPLTDDQKRLILALSEATLRSGDAEVSLPANKEAAVRLGWTITRFNRKLDNVCERLTKAGVSGLRGQVGTMAADRRTRLVEHAVQSGLVTPSDLHLLDTP